MPDTKTAGSPIGIVDGHGSRTGLRALAKVIASAIRSDSRTRWPDQRSPVDYDDAAPNGFACSVLPEIAAISHGAGNNGDDR